MAENFIGTRVDPELKTQIERNMEENGYTNMSDWFRDAIKDKLDPQKSALETKRNVKYLLDTDVDFRRELRKILD